MAAPAPAPAPAPHPIDTHSGPWTEDAFFALPENRWVELLDGSLLVSPSSIMLHQWLSYQLCIELNAKAPTGWRAIEAINVRLARDRIFIPDIAVVDVQDLSALYAPAADVRLVVEITSPGNAYVDRGIKPQLYAQAGIPHYLRVELDEGAPTSVVHTLDGEAYREVARFAPGEVTRLTEPFPLEVDLAELAAR